MASLDRQAGLEPEGVDGELGSPGRMGVPVAPPRLLEGGWPAGHAQSPAIEGALRSQTFALAPTIACG